MFLFYICLNQKLRSMIEHAEHELTLINFIAPVGIALAYITLSSLIKEPGRKKFNAIMIAGAGAAYLGGGLNELEFVFCSVMTFIAYKSLNHYYLIGIGWLLHTGWDIVHHFYGNPIVPFEPLSSFGCAICDPILALWFFMGAPSIFDLFKKNNTPTLTAH